MSRSARAGARNRFDWGPAVLLLLWNMTIFSILCATWITIYYTHDNNPMQYSISATARPHVFSGHRKRRAGSIASGPPAACFGFGLFFCHTVEYRPYAHQGQPWSHIEEQGAGNRSKFQITPGLNYSVYRQSNSEQRYYHTENNKQYPQSAGTSCLRGSMVRGLHWPLHAVSARRAELCARRHRGAAFPIYQ